MIDSAAIPSDDRVAEWVEGAQKVLAGDLPSGHKLWKSWALDLADQVIALANRLDDAEELARERDKGTQAKPRAKVQSGSGVPPA